MGLFRKKKQDVIDFSLMQKKGFLRESKANEREVIDFSGNSAKTDSGGFDFLSGLANAGGSSGTVTESLREARRKKIESSEINELRLKLDDSDFKLKTLTERIKELERRLNERGI